MKAIKSTRKLTNFNKQQLAQQLDTLAKQVADRGVYIAASNSDGFYDVIDYLRDTVVVHDVPTQSLAEHLSTALNHKHHFSSSYLQTQLDRYHKLNNDCVHYRHTLETTTDQFKQHLARTRLDDALIQLKLLGADLAQTI